MARSPGSDQLFDLALEDKGRPDRASHAKRVKSGTGMAEKPWYEEEVFINLFVASVVMFFIFAPGIFFRGPKSIGKAKLKGT